MHIQVQHIDLRKIAVVMRRHAYQHYSMPQDIQDHVLNNIITSNASRLVCILFQYITISLILCLRCPVLF